MKIEPLNYLIFDEKEMEHKYEEARAKFIAEYDVPKEIPSTLKWVPGGIFSSGYWTGEGAKTVYEKRPDLGLAEWNKRYPNGLKDYSYSHANKLTGYGQQLLVNKVDEIIKYINACEANKSKGKKGNR